MAKQAENVEAREHRAAERKHLLDDLPKLADAESKIVRRIGLVEDDALVGALKAEWQAVKTQREAAERRLAELEAIERDLRAEQADIDQLVAVWHDWSVTLAVAPDNDHDVPGAATAAARQVLRKVLATPIAVMPVNNGRGTVTVTMGDQTLTLAEGEDNGWDFMGMSRFDGLLRGVLRWEGIMSWGGHTVRTRTSDVAALPEDWRNLPMGFPTVRRELPPISGGSDARLPAVRIIDMECSIPRTEASEPEPGHSGAPSAKQPAGYGMANYGRIFRSRQEGSDHRPEMDLDAYVERLGKLGIVRSVPFGITNDEEAALLRRYPDRFLGLARISINAFKGMTGVRELERLVREEGFVALGVSALVDCIAASDRRYYPLYTKAAELGIPVRIYSSMNYANDRPYDLGHPRHLDQVAMDFPELVIIGGLGGWPWVNEMVALVRRHPNLHIDTSAHRAKYLGQAGSGWEMLIQFGNTLIQDKVLVGLSAGLVGQPHETLIEEYMNLPLKDTVKEKWLYKNAARVFGLD